MNSDIIIKNSGWIINGTKFGHKLKLDKVHRQIKNLSFNKFYDSIGGKIARDERLEKLKMPPIVFEYYKYLCITGNIPSIDILCKRYINTYCNILDNESLEFKKEFIQKENMKFSINSLEGRICRAYNSYNREIELLANLDTIAKKYKKEIEFYYSFKEDYYNGLDIIAIYDNKKYGICSYIETKHSISNKNLKNKNRHQYSENTIDTIAYFYGKEKNTYRLNEVDVYDEKEVKHIISNITKEEL